MAEVDQNESISLADLAGFDVSEVAEVRFSALPAGVYDFKVLEAELTQGENADGEKRFIAVFKFGVVDAVAIIEKGVDKDELVDRNHTEKLYIVPSKAEEGIGLIRAFIADMGLENTGPLGGLPGANPGIIDNTVGHIFRGKIIAQPDKVDKTRVYARLKLDAAKKKAA